ncbi:MAG: type secretion protein family [Enterovirga sp.]|jgi:type VI secretion system protein ImpB|nr:type secretion protein family [Enterovirga sp.]
MADTGQKFIKRNRPPRVHITYDDPYDAEKKIELPFVMGVLADLSGNDPGAEKADIADRKYAEIDMDNFDQRMAAIQPGVKFRVENKLSPDSAEQMSVGLRFNKMEDFSPAAVARQVPSLNKLLEAREQLSNLLRYMDGKVAATDQIKALLKDPRLMEALSERMAEQKKDGAESDA